MGRGSVLQNGVSSGGFFALPRQAYPVLHASNLKQKEIEMLSKLIAKEVATAKKDRGDGGGLWLRVSKTGSKSWEFRFTLPGRTERSMGLGSYPDVTLAVAREKALACRKLVSRGIDPIQQRNDDLAKAVALGRTFEETAEAWFESKRGTCTERTRTAWIGGFNKHVYPKIGSIRMSDVGGDAVTQVLRPIWRRMPVWAEEIRRVMECILDFAIHNGWRENENNPAQRERLKKAMPEILIVHKVKHQPALPSERMGEFMADMRAKGEGPIESKFNPRMDLFAARALEFQILTATRPSEARNAEWSEIDLEAKLWVIPAERMKMSRGHRVPLSAAAIAVLRKQKGINSKYVFPGIGNRKPLSTTVVERFLDSLGYTAADGRGVTPHGFRGTFSTWAHEMMNHCYDHYLPELALAHTVKTTVQAAYWHGDLLDQRRPLMEEWATFCSKPWQPDEKVIPLHRKESA
jgi:integrase